MKRRQTAIALVLVCATALLPMAAGPAQAARRAVIAAAPDGLAATGGLAAAAGCQQLIQNGGFENGTTPWIVTSNHQGAIISGYFPPNQPDPNSHWAAFLGGVNNADDAVSQAVTLPSHMVLQSLHFWSAMTTDEPPGAGTHDILDVSLYQPGGALIADLIVPSLDNTGSVDTWQDYSVDLRPYSGQAVRIQFEARSDAQFPTSFFVDDVSLTTCPASAWVYLPTNLKVH